MKQALSFGWLAACVAAMTQTASAGGPFGAQPIGPDITLCQLFGFQAPASARTGVYPNGINGGSVGTTSWNIGNTGAIWQQLPDSDHPKIAMNLYRLHNFNMNGVAIDRFTQLGQSWCKHGFFALSDEQCGPHPFGGQNGVPPNIAPFVCVATDGTSLGVGCTDTYSVALNANQTFLGPRFEINPWTADWTYTGSMFQAGGPSNTAIRRRLQFRDQDLIPPAGETYELFVEAQYVTWDDVDFLTSAGHKRINSYNWSGAAWTFILTDQFTDEIMGFAFDQWTGARQTMIAQSLPIVEQWTADADGPGGVEPSEDGRAMILSKVFNLGDGTYQYEYAVYNLDMDRQIGSFSVPIPAGVTISEAGWSGVFSHDEPTNKTLAQSGKAVDNQAWASTQTATDITWSTDPFSPTLTASNPLRWGTMYNFWFTADTGPTDGLAAVGLFTPGSPSLLDGVTNVPSAPPPVLCDGDADSDNDRDFADITDILTHFGTDYSPDPTGPGDANHDSQVNFADVTSTLQNFNLPCP